MINVCKELSDIAFQDPYGAGVILPRLVCKRAETVEGLVHSFMFPAGEGIGDEFLVEIWVKDTIDGVVE